MDEQQEEEFAIETESIHALLYNAKHNPPGLLHDRVCVSFHFGSISNDFEGSTVAWLPLDFLLSTGQST